MEVLRRRKDDEKSKKEEQLEKEKAEREKLEKEAGQVENKTVGNVMNKRLITASPDDPILKIGGQMVASGIHRVPVVDENKNLVGTVSRGDIYRAILANYFNI